MTSMKRWTAVALLALPLLSGCVMRTLTADNPNADISDDVGGGGGKGPIHKADFFPDTWVYHNPNKSPLDYAQIILSPVRVYENMASEVNKRDRRYLNEVGESFQNRLSRLLKDYMPAKQPNPLALRIDIELLALKPVMRIFKDRSEKVRVPAPVAGTKLEAACYDSMTGELIFAVSTFYKGDEYAGYSNPVLIKNIRGAFGEWSEHFKKRFDEQMSYK